jgi:hypothetical protein
VSVLEQFDSAIPKNSAYFLEKFIYTSGGKRKAKIIKIITMTYRLPLYILLAGQIPGQFKKHTL